MGICIRYGKDGYMQISETQTLRTLKLDNLKKLSVLAKILSFLSTTRILCVLASRYEANKILRTGASKLIQERCKSQRTGERNVAFQREKRLITEKIDHLNTIYCCE